MPADAIAVREAVEADRERWDALVRASAASGYHEWAWRGVIERTFDHRGYYLLAARGDAVEGVLPLILMKSFLFGRFLCSLPFLNYGGVVARTDEAAQALRQCAAAIAREHRCRHVELRHVDRRFPALPVKQHKVTMRLPLAAGMWERLDRKVRNQVRKAEKSGLTIARGGVDLLNEFYAVFAWNMHDLGTPVYHRRFFDEILRAFPDRARLLVVRLNDRPIAGGLTFRTGDTVEIPWASSMREHNALCPNHLLYWSAIQDAVEAGCAHFDFGRSTPNEGTFKFKEQWGAEPVPLHWEYDLVGAQQLPDQSPKNPKFSAAIAVWRRCPRWFTDRVGPYVVRSIP